MSNVIAKEVTASIKDGMLNISIPLQEPTLSKSGKSQTIASTHGNVRLPVTFNGAAIKLGLNAYI